VSVRWCCPARLDFLNRRPLAASEDIYASGLAVWELFVGKISFANIDSDEEMEDLEGQIRDGLTIDVQRIDVLEARIYVEDCLRVCCQS
jgi:hypothetical protein